MKYKVEDKVKIRQWKAMEREFGSSKYGHILTYPHYLFMLGMREYCEKVATIKRVANDYYELDIDNGEFRWTDNMFEGYAFEYGEVAEVSDDEENWTKAIYLGYIDGDPYPYKVAYLYQKKLFDTEKNFPVHGYQYARPLQKKHTIIIDGKEIEISEESYNNLKRSLGNE